MSPRTGRPPLHKEPRTEKLNIRLTKDEKQEIDDCAEKLKLTRTDTIMQGIRLLNKKE